MNWLNDIFSGIGNAVSGIAKSGGNALSSVVNAGSKLGQQFGGNLMNSFSPKQQPAMSMPSTKSFSSPATKPGVGTSSISGFGSTVPQGANLLKKLNFNTPSLPGQTSQVQAPQSQGNDWWNQMTKGVNFPQMALGGAINLAGNAFAPKVETPNIQSSQNYQNLQNFQGGLAPGMEDAINRNLAIQEEQQMNELRNVYKNVRPGTDYTTDSAYQRDLANLQRNQAFNKSDALAQAGNQYSSQEQNRLSELANADLAQIMLETGMNAQEAEQFKQSFSNIGSQFIQNAMPQQGGLMDLFKLLNGE